MNTLHFTWSFTTAYQLGRLARSLLTTSTHHSGVSPGGRRIPRGLLLKVTADDGYVFSSDVKTTVVASLSCSLTVVPPHSSKISAFPLLSHKVRPRISQRHHIWKLSVFECPSVAISQHHKGV